MQLWGHCDYCLPMMLIINLITLHVERERAREEEEEEEEEEGGSRQTNLDADRCVSEAASDRRRAERVAAQPLGAHVSLRVSLRASPCHPGPTSHSLVSQLVRGSQIKHFQR